MENASKALIIAGEVLIGIVILSILSFMFNKAFALANEYQTSIEKQRMVVFNSQYAKYVTETGSEPTYIYAEDVVTLTNQTTNWNNTTVSAREKIELFVLNQSGGIIFSTQNGNGFFDSDGVFDSKKFLKTYKLEGDPAQDNKEYKFSCNVEMGILGRINKITIQIKGVRDY